MPLNLGFVTMFDPEDSRLTETGSFSARIKSRNTVYVVHMRYVKTQEPKNFRFHREIFNAPDGVQVDHINGNALDNRKRSLRFATHSQNQWNKRARKDCSSIYRGVNKDGGKWHAAIQANKKIVDIGLFSTEIEAALAYDEHAARLHGEFARLNFPKEKPPLPLKEAAA